MLAAPAEVVKRYEALLNAIWTESARYLGGFSANLLAKRVAWEISLEYPAIELVEFRSDGVSCSRIPVRQEESALHVEEMFVKFTRKYMSILTKLLGTKRAREIGEKAGICPAAEDAAGSRTLEEGC